MSDHPRPTHFSRLIARCYPRELREQYAEDIARFIDDQRRDPRNRRNRFRTIAVMARLAVDALSTLASSFRNGLSPNRPPAAFPVVRNSSRSFSMDALLKDIRFAVRGFVRRPGFTLVAVGTLTLGIGANSAIFSLVNAVLIRPLPYPHPEQLVMIQGSNAAGRGQQMSIPDLEDMRARNRTFSEIGVWRTQSVNLTGLDRPDRIVGAFISASALHMLGTQAVIGRLFSPDETAIGGGQSVAVLSYATWQTRFGGRPDILGQTLILNGRPHVVIGVTSARLLNPFQSDIWLPITSAPNKSWFNRDNNAVEAIGRLKPGQSAADGERDLESIARQLATEHPAGAAANGVAVTDMHQNLIGNSRFMLVLLLGAVAAVLLIVCVNIANLQLARASTRQREMSLRAALGANRGRLVSQVITESLLLSLVGGVLGLCVGQAGVRMLVAVAGNQMQLPGFVTLAVDGRVLLYSFGVTVVTGILFGAPTAYLGTRTNLHNALRVKNEQASAGRFNIRNALVVAELALCIVLLAAAGLFTQSLVKLQRVNTGFHASHVLTAEFRLPAVKYDSSAKVLQFFHQALEQIRATPGVRDAAFIDAIPLSGNQSSGPYIAEGQPQPAPGAETFAQIVNASDGYFRTMEIPLRAGRDFNENDKPGSEPVVIINQKLADVAFKGISPIGKTIRFPGNPDQVGRIVGVVGNTRHYTLSENTSAYIYASKMQNAGIFTSIVVRTAGDPDAMAEPLRQALWSIDRDQPIWKIRSMEFLVHRDLSGAAMAVKMVGAFAVLALLLGIIGVYGVMSFAVAQRSREVGIRMALGARSSQVLQMILRSGMGVVGVATIIGVAGALFVGRYLKAQLYQIGAAEPLTMIGVPLLLGSVALIACWLPARRAARVDPAITLRGE